MPPEKNPTTVIAEPGKLEVLVSREFEAPRRLIFQAYTDPALYIQWMKPHGFGMRLETFEPNSGGCWRFIHIDPEGKEHAFHGMYHEVKVPERIIQTFEYEGLAEPGHVALDTIRFEELPGGRTRVITQSIFQSVQDRDWMVQGGMEEGTRETHESLDELLEKMKVKRAS